MFKKLFIVALSVLTLVISQPARAQNYETLWREFDARSLTYDDKRFLQMALAFEGVYNGLLDGAWGRLSQRALDRYVRNEFGTPAEDWHMAMLAYNFVNKHGDDGWDTFYNEALGMSLLVPRDALIIDPPSDNFVNFRHKNSSLSVSFGALTPSGTNNIHKYTLRESAGLAKPYVVRKDGFAVTSVSKSDGSTLYTRSNYVRGHWATIIVSAAKWDKNVLNAVTASITVGNSGPVSITPGGKLARVINKTTALSNDPEFAEEPDQNVAVAPQSQDPSEGGSGSAGSGFFVSVLGHVMTNAHVVDECASIKVDGKPATLLDKSDVFDLAILKASPNASGSVAEFADAPARLNSDVTAVGFPYYGLLGGLNVTRGSVSASKGLGNDSVQMQITAPVQSGNSGGPLLSADGSVVGVVVQKLDAVKIAEVTGDLPQNVNYAVRGELAKLFMSQNNIEPVISGQGERLAPEDLADKAKAYTVFIECE
jgi:S1-C subfamily serine protease